MSALLKFPKLITAIPLTKTIRSISVTSKLQVKESKLDIFITIQT